MINVKNTVWLRFFFFLLIGAAALPACKNRTKLILTSDEAPSTRIEAAAMLQMIGMQTQAMDNGPDTITAVFHDVLTPEEKRTVEAALQRLIRAEPKSPSFSIEITEQDTEIVELLELPADKGKKMPIALELSKGEHKLLQTQGGLGSLGGQAPMVEERQCVWAIPLKSKLPTLTYKKTIRPQAEANPDENESLRKLRDTLSSLMDNLVLTADHKITSDDPAFQKWAEQVQLELEDYVYFDFGNQIGSTNILGGPGTAYASDFDECAQSIFEKADDLFVGSFIFPKLAKNLKSFRFEESRF